MHGRIYQLIEESKTGQFDRISADTFDYEDFFFGKWRIMWTMSSRNTTITNRKSFSKA